MVKLHLKSLKFLWTKFMFYLSNKLSKLHLKNNIKKQKTMADETVNPTNAVAPTEVGTEDLQLVAEFALGVISQVKSSLADGKVTFAEIATMLPSLLKIPDLVAKKDAIVAEFKALSVEKVAALVKGFEGEIDNQKLVATIEDALTVAAIVVNVIDRYK